MKLVIANKCYSSWSMRPWMLLKAFGIPFEEVLIPFGPLPHGAEWKAKIGAFTPTKKVPALVDGDIQIWESLAIMEYIAEAFPDLAIWPRDKTARAMARAVSCEMLSGFRALRNDCSMNMGVRFAAKDRGPDVATDVARITAIWNEARARFGQSGPFLFGAFTAADAMYAPVVTRFRSYNIAVDPVSEAYMQAVEASAAFQSWRQAALAESWVIPEYEADEPVIENLRPHLPRSPLKRS